MNVKQTSSKLCNAGAFVIKCANESAVCVDSVKRIEERIRSNKQTHFYKYVSCAVCEDDLFDRLLNYSNHQLSVCNYMSCICASPAIHIHLTTITAVYICWFFRFLFTKRSNFFFRLSSFLLRITTALC